MEGGGSVACITHRKDVDGIASASLVKMATGARVILADYNDLISNLRGLDGGLKQLYICDLGVSEQLFKDMLDELSRLSKELYVEYIDHHPMAQDKKRKLRESGVNLTHSTKECTAILAYLRFKDRLPRQASLIAAYASITEYMDDSPEASLIIDGYDRPFIMLQATLLSYAIAKKGGDERYLHKLIDGLAKLEYPHRIIGVVEYAVEQTEKVASLLSSVEREGKRMRNLAYIKSSGGTGSLANFLRGAFNVPVGVAYKLKKEEGVAEISLRGSMSFKHDLGKLASKISGMLGGTGGGHPKASGARIPEAKISDFLKELDKALSEPVS